MFEKIKEISKVLILPGVILYGFGFVVVTSHLARFGIISFDVISSRFIIAGIYPLIGLSLVFSLAWTAYKTLPASEFFENKNFRSRLNSYLLLPPFIYTMSLILSQLFDLGRYSAPTDLKVLYFKPWLGKFDFIARVIDKINIKTVSYSFLLKYFIYIFTYVFIFITVAAVAMWLWKKFKSPSSMGDKISVDVSPEPVKREEKLGLAPWRVFVSDWFFISALITLFIYSFLRLRTELFDFNSFRYGTNLNSNLVFVWFYSSVFSIYVFLNIVRFPKEKITQAIVKDLYTPNAQYAFQQLLIPVLTSLFLFGATIFPRIPFSTGGGQPREVRIQTKSDINIFNKGDKVFLIGESNQFVFVVVTNKDAKALQINKDAILYIETKKN